MAFPSTADGLPAAAAGSTAAGVRPEALRRRARLSWALLGAGLVLEAAGAAAGGRAGDVLALAGYPALSLGAFLLPLRAAAPGSRPAVLDALVVLLGVALVQWVYLVDPALHEPAGAARTVDVLYPVGDVLLLVAVAHLLLERAGRIVAYRLLVGGLGLWVAADEIRGLAGADGRLAVLRVAACACVVAAALHPSLRREESADRRLRPRLTPARIGLLAAALLVGPAILLVERARGAGLHPYAVACSSAAIALIVLFRLAGLVRTVESARRAERLARREAEQAQQLLTSRNAQLVELDRLKDEFVSSVSHELRTPLTSITGYVELLKEEERDESRRSHLAVIERNAERLLGLVADLLFTARLQGGRLELDRRPLDLAALVADAVASAGPRAAGAGVELRVDAAPVPAVDGEATRLGQLLDNLISNALKFTPAGGRVDVRLAAGNGLVRLEVSDTGIGIPEAERERLFERFFRSEAALARQIPGTGLGLYISRAIVEAHGGRIGVEGAEGRGATFVVELPAAG